MTKGTLTLGLGPRGRVGVMYYANASGATDNIVAGCVDTPCDWEPPESCCDACDTDEAQELFDMWWPMVTEWLFAQTCYQFPGACPAETDVCFPCECAELCGCGPYATMDLDGAFCYPLVLDEATGEPCVEIVVHGTDDNGDPVEAVLSGPDSFTVRPDLLQLDLCEPLTEESCCGIWPDADFCEAPVTVRAVIGARPPKMLLDGAARFTCELVKECQGQKSCLPKGVKQITRRGLTMDVQTAPSFEESISFDNEGTGIHTLDVALRRWGCDTIPVYAHFDPTRRLDEIRRKVFTYRGRLVPTPPSCYEAPVETP